jgi:Domain of unknown function (DUF4345)
MVADMERLLLQIGTAFVAFALLGAGLSGALLGVAFLHGADNPPVDNYFRVMSAIVGGIGFLYLISIAHIERHGPRFCILSFLIVLGGLVHLAASLARPFPSNGTILGLFVELIAVPALWLLQRHVAKRAGAAN